jgi:hypothetical protein
MGIGHKRDSELTFRGLTRIPAGRNVNPRIQGLVLREMMDFGTE